MTTWNLIQDLRFGLRMLGKNPGFTAAAVITLALGIGANSAIFSVFDTVLLRPLPYEDPGRLVMVWETNLSRGRDRNVVSVPNFFDWRNASRSFEQMGAFSTYSVTYNSGDEPERVTAGSAAVGFFATLRARAYLGRVFREADYSSATRDIVVVSYRFWQSRLGSDPGVIGKRLLFESTPATVVGVLSPEFRFSFRRTDVWRPWVFDEEDRQNRKSHYLRVVARLKPDVSITQSQAEMDGIATGLAQEHPEWMTGWGVQVVSLHDEIVREFRPALLVLLGTVSLVLLIACANVANLLLSKATAREKEIAVRLSLGAGRVRLVRQLLTENLLLFLLGGAVGVAAAYWSVESLLTLTPFRIPRAHEIVFDSRIFLFALAIAFLTGVVFGLVPALRAVVADLGSSLKESGARSGSSRDRLRGALVVAEIALSLMLLIGAGLLIRSFWRVLEVDPGFDTERALAVTIALPSFKYPETHHYTAFHKELIERYEGLPGVRSVAGVNDLPLGLLGATRSFIIEGRPLLGPGEKVPLPYIFVTPGYFRTMGIPLLAGRTISERDDAEAPPVLVVNQSMANRFWPDEEPVGQRLSFEGPEGPWYEIVGVVGDTRQTGLDEPMQGTMYAPYTQNTWNWMRWMSLVLRTDVEPMSLASAARAEVREMDPDLPVLQLRTLEEQVADSVADRRFSLLLLGSFATIALALAAVGIYGVMAYAVSQRAREIGLRMALGARMGEVVALVIRQGMRLVVTGIGLGVAGAFLLTRWMESLLFGVAATDPLTFAGVSLVLAIVAFLANLIPALRASRVDPITALRYE
jgi:putative ABC transport system permease protein